MASIHWRDNDLYDNAISLRLSADLRKSGVANKSLNNPNTENGSRN